MHHKFEKHVAIIHSPTQFFLHWLSVAALPFSFKAMFTQESLPMDLKVLPGGDSPFIKQTGKRAQELQGFDASPASCPRWAFP